MLRFTPTAISAVTIVRRAQLFEAYLKGGRPAVSAERLAELEKSEVKEEGDKATIVNKEKDDKNPMKLVKKDAMVMHPGPINRGVELSSYAADCDQSHCSALGIPEDTVAACVDGRCVMGFENSNQRSDCVGCMLCSFN